MYLFCTYNMPFLRLLHVYPPSYLFSVHFILWKMSLLNVRTASHIKKVFKCWLEYDRTALVSFFKFTVKVVHWILPASKNAGNDTKMHVLIFVLGVFSFFFYPQWLLKDKVTHTAEKTEETEIKSVDSNTYCPAMGKYNTTKKKVMCK